MIRALFVAAVLSTAAPAALAQTAPPAAAAPTVTPGEAEFEAKAEAFGARMQEMGLEMQSAITAAAGDASKQDTDLDAIEARYQADVDGFVTALQAVVAQQQASAGEGERAGMQSSLDIALPQIRAITQQVRAQLEEAAAAAPAA